MRLEQVAPLAVAHLRHLLGRADQIGEQHGCEHAVGLGHGVRAGEEPLDRMQHRACLARERERVGSRELDVLGAHDPFREGADLGGDDAVAPVDHERRHADGIQHAAKVDVVEAAEAPRRVPRAQCQPPARANQRCARSSCARLGAVSSR